MNFIYSILERNIYNWNENNETVQSSLDVNLVKLEPFPISLSKKRNTLIIIYFISTQFKPFKCNGRQLTSGLSLERFEMVVSNNFCNEIKEFTTEPALLLNYASSIAR